MSEQSEPYIDTTDYVVRGRDLNGVRRQVVKVADEVRALKAVWGMRLVLVAVLGGVAGGCVGGVVGGATVGRAAAKELAHVAP